MKKLLPAIMLLCIIHASAQSAKDTTSRKGDALNMYLDCAVCDMDYLRTELTYINYVRDRNEAQVDVIVSSLQTASKGTEYTFVFKGQKEFKGQNDTLKYAVPSFVTDDAVRKGIVQTIKLGLVRYIAKTTYASKMSISFLGDTTDSGPATGAKDKWKAWVFSTGVFGQFNGQQLTGTTNLGASVTASKITPDWKVNINFNANYNSGYYVIASDSTIKSLSKSEGIGVQYVKSAGEHFSWGINGQVNSNTFNNIEHTERFQPGFEYSVFPYSQATHKLLRFLYYIYAENSVYYDTTIYGKTHTLQLGEELLASISFKEPWGSLYTSLDGSHYFYDLSKNNVQFSIGTTINLFEGFTLAVGGYAILVNNQIFLPQAGATEAEILLNTKALPTPYQYFMFMGIKYTFGSIYNSIVNPRFSPNSFNVNFSF